MTDNWVAGSGVGLTPTALFNATDFTNTLTPNGQSVMSTVTVANGGANLDKLMDVLLQLTVASTTIVAGANFALWLAELLGDGSTYWALLTAGTPAAVTPPWTPAAVIPLYAAASQVNLTGFAQGIIIPPRSFKAIIQNNSGFTLTTNVTVVDYITYNP